MAEVERETPGFIHLLGRKGVPVGQVLPRVPFLALSSPADPQDAFLPQLLPSELERPLASTDGAGGPARGRRACSTVYPHRAVPGAARLTEGVPVFRHGVDALVGQDLHVLPAGAAVELVGPDEAAAELIRHQALLPHMLCKIR